MKRLEQKKAIITGGNSGIGFETAKEFLQNGAQVLITGRNKEKLAQAVMELGDGASYIEADAANLEDTKKLVDIAKEQFGKIDILFLNAGVAYFSPLNEVDEEFYDHHFNINVKGLYFTFQKLLPLFNKGGSVIINSSINAHIGMPGSSVYAATKAAVLSLTKTLAAEAVEVGVRVNAISPGPIETPIFDKMDLPKEEQEKIAEQIQSQVPMGRFGKPGEIAKTALFLASDDSSFMLGSEIIVDGGMSRL